jgi:hypothetical protein
MMQLCAIAACTALVACSGKHDGELGEAPVQVRRFFDAVVHGDCTTIGSLLPVAHDAPGCAKLLHEWRDDLGIQLIEIPDVRRDGRDRSAMIVRANVMRRGQQQTMLVRVTHQQGVWQLVL